VNFVGPMGAQNLKFPIVFKSARKKTKLKLRKNGNFYAKLVFDKILVFGVTLKQMTVKT